MAILQFDNKSVVLIQVLLLRDNDLRAQEAAQEAFVMMWRIGCDVARMMKARLALVTVD